MEIDLGYRHRPQFRAFHLRRQRWACLVAHRRAGKTVACVADLIDAALRTKRPDARYAYIAPLYVQAKDVAWAYLRQFTAPIPGVSYNESELRVDLPNGARIRLYGADNYDRMRGLYLDGAVLDEYADIPPAAFGGVIRPALSDRRGWGVFIGTPKGRNLFFELWERAQQNPNWFTLMLRASETGLLPQDELAAAAAEMTPEQYAQEFECSFDAAILGAYYGREIADAERSGRITHVPYDPALPVHTAWDLGAGVNMAIWLFQVAGASIHVIDHIEGLHQDGIPDCVRALNTRPYRYGLDFVPHDARAVEIGTGRTRIETLIGLGRNPRLVPDHRVMDGINAARMTLPRAWFDAENCKHGVEALRQYRAEYDEKTRAFRDTPKHDWTSHFADAWRHLAMAWRTEFAAEPARTVQQIIAEMAKPKTFGELMAEHELAEQDE